MSKLETAFSKALKEQSVSRGALEGNKVNLGTVDASMASSRQDDFAADAMGNNESAKGLISAKNRIKEMKQQHFLSDSELANKRLIYPRMKDINLLNIYRNLRTKLLSAGKTNNFVTLVTSVVGGGGSSLISANVATAFAFDEGKTALLIEGNISTPSLGKLFEVNGEALGLMDFLAGDHVSVNDVLHETGVPRLRFIPGGKVRENAAEYFTSDRMKSLIQEVLARYPERYPIIDAPSIKDSADARILLELCDLVILVVPYGLCTKEEIKYAAQTIGSQKLAGIVLNQF